MALGFTATSVSPGTLYFVRLTPIRVRYSSQIHLFTTNDGIILKYDDRVLLRFTPDIRDLILALEDYGEYVRDTAIVNIIDNDCKCSSNCYY